MTSRFSLALDFSFPNAIFERGRNPKSIRFVDTRLCRPGLARKNRFPRLPVAPPIYQGFAAVRYCGALPSAGHTQAASRRQSDCLAMLITLKSGKFRGFSCTGQASHRGLPNCRHPLSLKPGLRACSQTPIPALKFGVSAKKTAFEGSILRQSISRDALAACLRLFRGPRYRGSDRFVQLMPGLSWHRGIPGW